MTKNKKNNSSKKLPSTNSTGENLMSHIPKGTYHALLAFGAPNKENTCYKLIFEICQGDYTGHKLWKTLHLATVAGNRYSRGLLRKLGIGEPSDQAVGNSLTCLLEVDVAEYEQSLMNSISKISDISFTKKLAGQAEIPCAPATSAGEETGEVVI